MATEVKVPTLGESITTGILSTWHVQDGAYVEEGQALYDLETDKITSEGMAEVSGVITLKVAEDDEVDVGSIIAVIDESATGGSSSKDDSEEAKEAPAEEPDSKDESKSASSDAVSPAVRRIAGETGINPADVKGSGKEGRVTKGDMLAAEPKAPAAAKESKAAPAQSPAAAPKNPSERQTRSKMSPLRKTIAQRLVAAQQETAMLTTFNEVDMEPIMTLRKKHQDAFVAKHGLKLGFMSFFTKAVVQALQSVPQINAQLDGNTIVQNHYYDISIAVSTPKGLMVPVLRDCEQKSFAQIESDIIGYANKAREGKISIDDLQGGVFTITNGGIFGSMLSTPILNQPQSAILGMHTIQERPVARNGQVVIKPMMYLALSYDHRIVDGKEAVTFLVKVKEALEDPARLLLDL